MGIIFVGKESLEMEPFITDLCKFTRRNVTRFDVILWLFDMVAGHVFCQKIFNGASPTKIGTNQTLKKIKIFAVRDLFTLQNNPGSLKPPPWS